MTQNGESDDAGVKTRLREGLDAQGETLVWLAERTGEAYKNVQRWVGGSTRVPVEFVARYIEVVPVDPVWLLTGKGEKKPAPIHKEREVSVEPIEDSERLGLIRLVADLHHALAHATFSADPDLDHLAAAGEEGLLGDDDDDDDDDGPGAAETATPPKGPEPPPPNLHSGIPQNDP